MSSTYDTMKNTLEKLNLYSFDGTTVDCEIRAYAYVLDKLNAELSQMLSECFIDSAESYGLKNREIVFTRERSDLDVIKRRQMLKLRESICMTSFTVEKIREAIKSFGLDAVITEFPSLYLVRVDAVGDYSLIEQAWIQKEIEKIMPAHLSVQVIFSGPTWDESDAKGNTFASIDSLDFTWDEIDSMD